ncbi:MAG TPA: type II toxin-antitoxin system RelE/ParE family toxin [Rhizomicrobium sp.]|nr:type II toxin-antitoxin system RelE/ParE family toxin [Rhizomicrobium sp.]
MADQPVKTSRVFKSAWFAKAARKARIGDRELCEAIAEIMKGQADDLGGGVFKKRLNKNMHRSIVLARGKKVWVLEYLFAKKDRANIEDGELVAFRRLAKGYEALSDMQIAELVENRDLWEICHGGEK